MNTDLKSSLRALVAQIEDLLKNESPLVAYLQSISTPIEAQEFEPNSASCRSEELKAVAFTPEHAGATYWRLNHSVIVADVQYEKGTKFMTAGRVVEFHVPKVLAYPEEKRVVEDLGAIIDTLKSGDTFWFMGSEVWYSLVPDSASMQQWYLDPNRGTTPCPREPAYYVDNEKERVTVTLIFKPAKYQYTAGGDPEILEPAYVQATVPDGKGGLLTEIPEALKEVVAAIVAAEGQRTK